MTFFHLYFIILYFWLFWQIDQTSLALNSPNIVIFKEKQFQKSEKKKLKNLILKTLNIRWSIQFQSDLNKNPSNCEFISYLEWLVENEDQIFNSFPQYW